METAVVVQVVVVVVAEPTYGCKEEVSCCGDCCCCAGFETVHHLPAPDALVVVAQAWPSHEIDVESGLILLEQVH